MHPDTTSRHLETSWEIQFTRIAQQVSPSVQRLTQVAALYFEREGYLVRRHRALLEAGCQTGLNLSSLSGMGLLGLDVILVDGPAAQSRPGARLDVKLTCHRTGLGLRASELPARAHNHFSSAVCDVLAGPGGQLRPEELVRAMRDFLHARRNRRFSSET